MHSDSVQTCKKINKHQRFMLSRKLCIVLLFLRYVIIFILSSFCENQNFRNTRVMFKILKFPTFPKVMREFGRSLGKHFNALIEIIVVTAFCS